MVLCNYNLHEHMHSTVATATRSTHFGRVHDAMETSTLNPSPIGPKQEKQKRLASGLLSISEA